MTSADDRPIHHSASLLVAAAVVLLALWLALPSSANAATYAVDACQRPDGTPAATDGWSPSGRGVVSTTNS